MGNNNSSKEIEELKAKTLRKTLSRAVLTLSEYKENTVKEYQQVTIILHDSVLSVLIGENIENSFEVNKDLYVKLILNDSLIVAFVENNNPKVWKFRDEQGNLLTSWEKALILSKRPIFVNDSRCQQCKSAFTSFRRRHHCRSCGRILCNECSQERIILESLGYQNKKRTCEKCVEGLQRLKNTFEGVR
jgi:hypothetical protein